MRPAPVVDLRSDTVTRPDDQMREAMRTAEVGNAAWGEDPTVTALERAAAEAVGHEAALFVPSGTMGNQVALRAWTAREGYPEVILEERCHILVYESGGLAQLSRAQARPIRGVRGAMDPRAVAEAIVGPVAERLKARTALVCVEDTHNLAGGAVLPLDNLEGIRRVADDAHLPVHLDGARLFNAAVAQGVEPARIGSLADSVMFCFSKGLGAPIGSVVCGDRAFVDDAERVRLLLGGAMRQAGIVAAAALVALEQGPARLADDHRRAKRLAEALAKLDGIGVDPGAVETNIVIADVSGLGVTAEAFCERVGREGVLYDAMDTHLVRAVTHRDVDDEGLERAIAGVERAFG